MATQKKPAQKTPARAAKKAVPAKAPAKAPAKKVAPKAASISTGVMGDSGTKMIAVALLAGIIGAGAVFAGLHFSGQTGGAVTPAMIEAALADREAAARAEFTQNLVGDAPYFGQADAPVTIVEFTDYQCPFCKRHADATLPLIKSEYIDKGLVRYVVRDLAIDNPQYHAAATPAALAAACAAEQGQFAAAHAALFAAQASMPSISSFAGSSDELRIAAAARVREIVSAVPDLDREGFESCFDSKKYADRVTADLKFAESNGIGATPSVFVGDKLIEGAQPFEAFKAEIDRQLAAQK